MATAKTIAVDLDEVLGQFIPQLCKYHNAAYPESPTLTPAGFFSYRFCEVWGGDDEGAIRKVHDFFESEFFDDIPVVPGAPDGVRALKQAGYRLVIVTSRQLAIEEQTRRWVDRHFGGVFDAIAFGNHWGKSGRKTSKPELCRELNADILIDDAVSYCTECARTGIRAFLFGDYAWNQTAGSALPAGVERVARWDQAVQSVVDAHD